MNAGHLLLTHDHGSPPELVALAHATIGIPDVDPASHLKWNALIRARRLITEEEDARITPWFPDAPAPNRLASDRRAPADGDRIGTVFLNPPNDKRGELVAIFWRTLVEYYARGWCTAALFIGFNVEQLSRLQRVGARMDPLAFPTLIPRERIAYRKSVTELGEDPAHASFVSLLSRDPRRIRTFHALGHELGRVVTGGGF